MTIYRRHLRHRKFDRIRHSKELLAFFDEQAARLSGTGTASTVTFSNTDNHVTLTDHGFESGDGPYLLSNSGGALPAELDADTFYWVNVVDTATFTLHLSEEDALTGTNVVNFNDNGTGTNSILVGADAYDIFLAMQAGKTAEQIRVLDNIDNL